ncbi:MAG: hypothetical protein H6708_22215 [Kofleriaceae bacterium]|nr:hypothetical protein [Myxococcales bacterium]MCB9563123.1 hypothetical protein [Kofleriaceae bacterium]
MRNLHVLALALGLAACGGAPAADEAPPPVVVNQVEAPPDAPPPPPPPDAAAVITANVVKIQMTGSDCEITFDLGAPDGIQVGRRGVVVDRAGVELPDRTFEVASVGARVSTAVVPCAMPRELAGDSVHLAP